jgi:hypothetical protein
LPRFHVPYLCYAVSVSLERVRSLMSELGSDTQGDRNFVHVVLPPVLDLRVQFQTKIMINIEFMYLQLALEASCIPVWYSNAVTSNADTTLQIQYVPISGHLQNVRRRACKCLLHRQCMRYGDGVCGRGCSLQCCSEYQSHRECLYNGK